MGFAVLTAAVMSSRRSDYGGPNEHLCDYSKGCILHCVDGLNRSRKLSLRKDLDG